jgi:hypothetical protein
MLKAPLMVRLIWSVFKLGFFAAILLCLFPSLTSFLTVPLAKFRAAAASGTLTGNPAVDRGVDGLPVNGAIENINRFPGWAKEEVKVLPSQVASVDSWVAETIPNVPTTARCPSSNGTINWLHASEPH